MAESLAEMGPEIDLRFVSYAAGAETLKAARWPLIDLELSDDTRFVPTLLLAHQVISDLRPDVVISHEEFAALPAAKLGGVPSIFIGDWFPPPGSTGADALVSADALVCIEDRDAFPLPPYLTVQPHFVGPVVRPMSYTRNDRARARHELGIPAEAMVVSVVPGSWATEERAPIADLVLAAYDRLNRKEKRLFWLSRKDAELLHAKSAGRPGVSILSQCDVPERIFVASDVIITKGNRGSTLDAASLGVPSISLSSGQNPIDEILILRIRSNVTLNAKTTDPKTLMERIEHVIAIPAEQRVAPLGLHERRGRAAAQALLEEIRRLAKTESAGANRRAVV